MEWLFGIGTVFFFFLWIKSKVQNAKPVSARPVDQRTLYNRIETHLDLAHVREKLTEKGWDSQRISQAIREYKEFLYLYGTTAGSVTIVPWTDDLDEAWHAHILAMKKYERDSLMLFSEVLYHDPSLARGSEEQKKAVAFTAELRRKAFQAPTTAKRSTESKYESAASSSDDSFLPWYIFYVSQPTDGGVQSHSHHGDGGGSSDHGHSSSHSSCSSSSSCSGGSSCGGGGGCSSA